jgi:ubiquinone biosynthesis protein
MPDQEKVEPEAVSGGDGAALQEQAGLPGGDSPDLPDASARALRRPAGPPLPFPFNPFAPYRGVVRRFFVVHRHVLGLLAGGLVAHVRDLPPHRRRGLRSPGQRLLAAVLRLFLHREVAALPFPQQLRRRLEWLGPTYIKLGQILAIREDLLPRAVTAELASLFDRLPPIPFPLVRAIIEDSLGQPLAALFARIDEAPLGSASIAQAHRAETPAGDQVVVKVIKPGIREVITSDLKLLEIVGHLLQWIIPRYQPRQIIAEFSAYTLREVDFTYEAEHAEIFAANFRDEPGIVFPRVYRALSARDVLTMAFLEGFKPGSPETFRLDEPRRRRLVGLGAAAIIRMLYRDGFFHADLHAGNLLILPGDEVRLGFIDLGMVGRFEEKTRRRMMYYFHALVSGDVEGATKYLIDMAKVGPGGDPYAFRRAVADLSRRFLMHGSGHEFSVAQLILASVGLGGRYRVFFPVEMTLMVKALVTFEGVGRLLEPHLEVAALSQQHVAQIFREQFDPQAILRELLRNAPEMVDLVVGLPALLSTGVRIAEERLNERRPERPLAGLRSSILAGACLVGGVLAVVQSGPVLLWASLFAAGLLLYVFGR